MSVELFFHSGWCGRRESDGQGIQHCLKPWLHIHPRQDSLLYMSGMDEDCNRVANHAGGCVKVGDVEQAERLFQIIQILRRSSRPVTSAQLADELEVARRTIYRDIAHLIGQRVPIDGEAGFGYVLDPRYDMPPLMSSQRLRPQSRAICLLLLSNPL